MLIELTIIGISICLGCMSMCWTRDQRDTAKKVCKSAVSFSRAKTMDVVYGVRPIQCSEKSERLGERLGEQKGETSVGKNVFEASFSYNLSLYKIPIVIKRGPKMIPEIKENELDITQDILPYMGPNLDFYGMNITPEMLGYKEGLTVNGLFVSSTESILS